MNSILIIGATSDIGIELAKIYAKNGYNLYLACRNPDTIKSFSIDLSIRNSVKVTPVAFDVLEFSKHHSFFESLAPKPTGIIMTVGYLGDQETSQREWEEYIKIVQTNFTGPASILNIFSNYIEKQKEGFIVGISSVAGDRGRASNYSYGSSKAAFTTYLSGLRNRLQKSNIQVLTVKPGFVYTKMTAHLKLPKPLSSYPEKVAKHIFKAQQAKKNVLYVKWIWKYIMGIIKLIPEGVFKKLKL